MYKYIYVVVFLLLMTSGGCEHLEFTTDVPDCINALARSIKREAVRNPPAMIVEWQLTTGEKYYYIPPYCCDMFSELYDSDCNLICAPDGGFSGQGDGRCPADILNSIESTKVVWKDDR
ncbi:MAG: hypothetical protein WCD55_05055 [Bacteroidales bacterium]